MTKSSFDELDAAQIWAHEKLKLSSDTLARLGVITDERRYFPDLECDADAIVFPFPDGWKARAVGEETYTTSQNLRPAFWNSETVLRAIAANRVDRVYVVQGELNGCALVEAGISPDAVLTVPNGIKPVEGDAGDRYDFVRDAKAAGLGKAPAIVWIPNPNHDGMALRSDMVRIFGAARFWFVDLPEWATTVGEVLIQEGPAALLDRVVNGALPWPVTGLYRISELPDPPPLTLWKPGFPEWENKMYLAPRTLSVATGHPGHGKTLFWTQAWFNVAKAYGIKIALASFETRPKPHVRRQLRTLYSGALEKDLSCSAIAEADHWINEHFLFMVPPDGHPTLEWLLEMAEIAVVRHGVRVVQVDPWNRLESARDPRRESETDFIGKCLRSLHAFAHDANVHFQILAHPAKMDPNRRGSAPLLEDISGSKNWDNAVDQGFVIHRDEVFTNGVRQTAATLFYRKSRFEELGFPCTFELEYDLRTGAYRSIDYDPRPAHTAARKRMREVK